MRNLLLSFAASSALCISSALASVPCPLVTFSQSETKSVEADMVSISYTISTDNKDNNMAIKELRRSLDQGGLVEKIEALKDQNIAGDIKITPVSSYVITQDNQQLHRAYVNISVTKLPLKFYQSLSNVALGQRDITNIGSNFSSSQVENLEAEILDQLVSSALKKSDFLAKSAGYDSAVLKDFYLGSRGGVRPMVSMVNQSRSIGSRDGLTVPNETILAPKISRSESGEFTFFLVNATCVYSR